MERCRLRGGERRREMVDARHVADIDLDGLRAGGDERGERAVPGGERQLVRVLLEKAPRDADAHPRRLRRAGGGGIVGHGHFGRGRVQRVMPGDRRQHQRIVEHGPRQRAHIVEREGKAHHAEPADPRLGGLHAGKVAEAGGQADRAAGVRAERAVAKPPRCRRPGAGRGTPGDAVRVPGVAAGPEMLVMAGRPHGELGHVEAAQIGGARFRKPRERGRGDFGPEIAADLAAAGREAARAVIHVLVRQRHAGQGPERLARGALRVHGGGAFAGRLLFDAHEGVQLRVDGLDAGKRRFRQLHRREVARGDAGRRLGQGEVRQAHAPASGARRAMAVSICCGSVSKSDPSPWSRIAPRRPAWARSERSLAAGS